MKTNLSRGGRGSFRRSAVSPATGRLLSLLELTLLQSVSQPQGIFLCFVSVLLFKLMATLW